MARRLAALLFAALALAVAGCGGEDDYSEDVEETFTEECVKAAIESGQGALTEAQADEYCQCTYDDIEANVPFEEFAEYDERAQEDENAPVPPKIAAAVERCAKSLG
jgi:hypothetical protein